jgi:hypothetical protein
MFLILVAIQRCIYLFLCALFLHLHLPAYTPQVTKLTNR